LFSLRTFLKSLKTVFFQKDDPFYDSNGFITGQTVIKDVDINFSKVFAVTRKEYIDAFFMNSSENFFITKNGDNLFNYFRKMIRDAYDSNLELVVVISPMHQYFLEGIMNKGLLDSYSEWKKTIKNIVEEIAIDNNKKEFLLLDYSVDDRNSENITNSYGEKMRYWNDAYHPSVFYGNEIIDNIFLNDRKVYDR